MGSLELNIYARTILFLLTPIIVPAAIGVYAAICLKDAITGMLPAPEENNSGDLAPDSSGLYKYAMLGDTDRFITTLTDLAADGPNALVEILSHLSPQKNTFLHIAVSCENEALAVALLKIHPLLMFKQNDEGDSPLHIAAKEGKRLLKEVLVREKEIRSRGTISGRDEGELATNTAENGYPFLYNMRNNQENTALHEALINGHTPGALLLIKMDPTVTNFFELVNKENKSPLYLAAEAGNVKLVKIMKKRAAGLDDRVCRGKSPLQAAILSRTEEMLEILSSMRLNIVSPKDEEGKTSLHYATSMGYIEGVRFLLGQSTIDAYQPDESGVFPIHTAAIKGYVDIIEEFLQCRPDLRELLSKHGQNILHMAATYGRDDVVKYVLKNSMLSKLINQKDNNGDTPLHLAARYRHPMAVSTLTWDKRTNLKLVNNEGFTVLDIAEGNMDSIASFHGRLTWIALKSAGAQRAHHLHVLLRKKGHQLPTQMPWPSSQLPNFDYMLRHAGSKLSIFEGFKDRVNTLLLVTSLVATVTFAAGFTMPGGYNNSDPKQGMATMLTERSLQIFVICDTVAMYSSIIVAVTLIWAQLGDLNLVLSALRLALPMLGIALTMMSVAFTAGVYAVVSNLHWLAGVVLGMGGIFVAVVLSLFVPLFFPSQSNNLIVRYITYYPFRLVVLASGNYNEELEELPPSPFSV